MRASASYELPLCAPSAVARSAVTLSSHRVRSACKSVCESASMVVVMFDAELRAKMPTIVACASNRGGDDKFSLPLVLVAVAIGRALGIEQRRWMMLSADEKFSLLLDAMHNERVAAGNMDEALHQRCVLRCFTQCLHPVRATDTLHCVETCRDLCVHENRALDDVDGGESARSLASHPYIIAACFVSLLLVVIVMKITRSGRLSLRAAVDRVAGKRSHFK